MGKNWEICKHLNNIEFFFFFLKKKHVTLGKESQIFNEWKNYVHELLFEKFK